jgi:hypothetical protein
MGLEPGLMNPIRPTKIKKHPKGQNGPQIQLKSKLKGSKLFIEEGDVQYGTWYCIIYVPECFFMYVAVSC